MVQTYEQVGGTCGLLRNCWRCEKEQRGESGVCLGGTGLCVTTILCALCDYRFYEDKTQAQANC